MSSKIRIFNSILNPDLWDANENIIPEVSSELITLANNFYNKSKLKSKIKDILFVGSSANYNWSSFSDIDINIITDFEEISTDIKSLYSYIDTFHAKWYSSHDPKVKHYNVEIYIKNLNDSAESTGVYSLLRGMWIKKPTNIKITLDRDIIKRKYKNYICKLNNIVKNPSVKLFKLLLNDIYKMKEATLSSGGNYSNESTVFKLLKKSNIIDKLKSLKNIIYNQKVL